MRPPKFADQQRTAEPTENPAAACAAPDGALSVPREATRRINWPGARAHRHSQVEARSLRWHVQRSVALVSDYRLRGVSLSDRGPAVQASLGYDGATGWYAGVFASSLQFGRAQRTRAQLLTYAGYAWRLRDGLNAEAGVNYSAFFGGASGYDYPELYVGLTADRLSGRVYYATRYFREDTPVVYAELNFAQPLSEHIRLLAHLGRLQRGRSEKTDYGLERHRLDARLGLGTTLHDFDLQLAWVQSEGETKQYPSYPTCRDCTDRGGWVLSLSRSW